MDGDGGNGQWLTYDQVAEARGTSRDAAIRWIQRRRFRRQPGNDGRVLVLIPHNAVEDAGARAPQRTPLAPPDVGDGAPPNAHHNAVGDALPNVHHNALPNAPPSVPHDTTEVWRAAIDTLRSQLIRADQREDVMRAELEQLRSVIRDAEQAARIATDALSAARRAEEERKARGRMRRVWLAWRGR